MLPPAAASLDEADAAIELWEFYKRRKLDPAQVLAVQVMMATRPDGLWAAATTGREESRQNGKGDEIEVPELWGLVQRAERILHTVHDAVLLATEAHTRLLSTIEGHADLRRLKARHWSGTGQQMIEMRNGGIIWYRTRTGGGGRGVDEVDRLVVDEAQHAEEEHLAAVAPTMLASANPQLNALGSAGIAGKSRWWWRLRKRALSDDPGDFGYVAHTAENVSLDAEGRVMRETVDVNDRRKWHAANPAIASGRVTEAFLEEELRNLGDALFAREHLCVWDAEPDEGAANIPRWAELADRHSQIASGAAVALAVSPHELGPQWSSFAVAGRRDDGRYHVEALDHRAGTWWVVDRAKEFYKERQLPLRVRTAGAEGQLIGQLREAGVAVEEINTMAAAQSCGAFIAAAGFDDDGRPLLHHLDDPDLNKALRNAARRTSTNGSSSWDELKSKGEISALMAVSIAFGGVPLHVRAPRIWSLASAKE